MKFSRGNKRQGNRKLTGEQILAIRELYGEGNCSQASLARKFQVSINTIYRVVNGLSWQNMAGDGSREFTDAEIEEAQKQFIEEMAGKQQLPQRFVDEIEKLEHTEGLINELEGKK